MRIYYKTVAGAVIIYVIYVCIHIYIYIYMTDQPMRRERAWIVLRLANREVRAMTRRPYHMAADISRIYVIYVCIYIYIYIHTYIHIYT